MYLKGDCIPLESKTLEIKLFGTFDILYEGRSLFHKGKSNNKIFEILKYLLINSDKELSPEIICENVWPSTEYMDIRNTITTYIFRLNKFLKSDNNLRKDISSDIKILCQKGSYKLIISDRCRLDIRDFCNIYDEIEKQSEKELKIKLINKCLNLYKGELLKDCNFDGWISHYRNYYRRIFSDINRDILTIYYESQKYKDILKVCNNMFEIYTLDECANLYYLKALYKLNYINEAISHYEYISSKFVSELGVPPNDTMKELYETMKYPNKVSGQQINNLLNLETIFTDDSEFWGVFSNAIDEYIEQKLDARTYAIGHASFKIEENVEHTINSIVKSMQAILRKDDYFTIFHPNMIVFVLNDVPECFYSLLKDRLLNVLKQNGIDPKEIELNISIKSCVSYKNLA